MNNKNNNGFENDDKNKRGDNYDRRPITDPPKADEQDITISAKRKGFYIILLLGITAIGIYALLSALIPKPENNKRIETGSVFATPTPYAAAVPANANALLQNDEDDAAMPTARPTAKPAAEPRAGARFGQDNQGLFRRRSGIFRDHERLARPLRS